MPVDRRPMMPMSWWWCSTTRSRRSRKALRHAGELGHGVTPSCRQCTSTATRAHVRVGGGARRARGRR
eukprot:4266644-Prymnesium_polylepis.1